MRHFILGMAATALTVSTGAAFGQDVKTHKITDNIYMLEGRGGNVGVCVGDDGVLIIDTQYANMAGPIRDAIAKLSKKELKYILNTHFHGDHTGGNKALGQGVPIVANKKVYDRMARGKDLSNKEFANSLPSITTTDTWNIDFNGESIKLVAFPPAHTDTDSVVYFTDSNVAHLGDHFFVERFPYVDLAGGGSVTGYLKNLDKLLGELKEDTQIIPGHGRLATKQDLRDFKKLIEDSVAVIQKGIDDGKDDKSISRDGLPDRFKDAGSGFVNERRWIGIVYNDLTR